MVKADNSIVVLAPLLSPTQPIIQFVETHQSWIQKRLAQNQLRAAKRPKLMYTSGDILLYLGRPYHLQLNPQSKKKEVRLEGDTMIVHSKSTLSPTEIKSMIEQWYKAQAHDIFIDRLGQYELKVGKSAKKFRLSNAKSRWGSCTRSGTISLRWTLIMAPVEVLDYVVVHELCHLVHMNHSPSFWKLVKTVFPDFKSKERWLKTDGIQLQLP
jgi:hypothetical protein